MLTDVSFDRVSHGGLYCDRELIPITLMLHDKRKKHLLGEVGV
jgi:hypothetical protein